MLQLPGRNLWLFLQQAGRLQLLLYPLLCCRMTCQIQPAHVHAQSCRYMTDHIWKAAAPCLAGQVLSQHNGAHMQQQHSQPAPACCLLLTELGAANVCLDPADVTCASCAIWQEQTCGEGTHSAKASCVAAVSMPAKTTKAISSRASSRVKGALPGTQVLAQPLSFAIADTHVQAYVCAALLLQKACACGCSSIFSIHRLSALTMPSASG